MNMAILRTTLCAALLLSAAACGQSDRAEDQSTGGMDANAAAGPSDASALFAGVEKTMSEAMMSAVGSDAGDNWVRKMIAHHQGAIDMSQLILERNPEPDVAEMARMSIEKQRREIAELRKLQKDGAPNPQSAELYRQAMMAMDDKMKAVTGADPSNVFMRKMLEHHRGGVALSDVALKNGVAGAIRAQVVKTREDQDKDAKMVEIMLGGATMKQAMEQSGAKSVRQAKAESASPAKAKANPAPAPAPAAKAPPIAQTQPETNTSTCLPEHRAAGHC